MTGDRIKATDLVTVTYMNIKEAKNPVPCNQFEFIKYFSKCMNNEYKWIRSNYNQQSKSKELLIELEYKTPTVSEPCRQCMWGEVEQFKITLPPHEKELFELYFEQGCSGYYIADELSKEFGCKVTRKSIDRMIAPIKEKIKNKLWGKTL